MVIRKGNLVMKNQVMKVTAITAAIAAMMCTSAFAAETTKNVQIQFDNIQLVVDGVPITPKDANGSRIEPFIYNGTTYLPIRAVGEAIGKQVTWDGATKTVYLGEAPNETNYLVDVCPAYDEVSYYSGKTFEIDGEKYNSGSFYFTSPWTSKPYASFNLNGEYESLDTMVGHTSSTKKEKIINIYLDGKLSQTIVLEPEQMAEKVHIPLNNALQLKIGVEKGEGVGFANARLTK